MNNEGKIKYSPALIPQKLQKPNSKESFYTDFSREKDIKDFTPNDLNSAKEVIMLEFNPAYEQSSGECQVQLVPLTMFKTKNNFAKERPLTHLNNYRNVF